MQIRQSALHALIFAAAACGQATVTPKTPMAVASPASSGADALLPGRVGNHLVIELLSVSAPLRIDRLTVSAGGTLTGTVTYQNTSTISMTLRQVAIAARPPGGTHGGGPYADLQPYLGSTTLLPGATVTLTASRTFTASDPIGQWETYSTYQDSAGVYHDGPSLFFTVAPPGPAISAPLRIDKTTVSAGGTLTGTVTYQNASASSMTLRQVAIAARPPGGTHSGGPYADLQPYLGSTTLLPGATVTLTASRTFTASDPIGQWETYSTYQDSAGVYHDGPSLFFTVATTASAALGINVGLVADWDPTQMFADVMKQARHWGSVSAPWDEAAPVDANGWPTGDAAAVFMINLPHVGGTYKLSFTGNATVALSGATDPTSGVQNKLYTAASNSTTADVVLGAAEHNLFLSFAGQPGGVKNVKLMRPGHQPAEVFNQAFLARLKYFSAMRFMDTLATNNNPQAVWSDRMLPTNAEQQTTPSKAPAGVAWEFIVLLANATGKDVWINIPHLALGPTYQLGATDYATKVAQLFKYGSDGVNPYTGPFGSATANPVPQTGPVYPALNSNLKIYVEFSNELWNGVFGQSPWIANQANAAIAARDPDLCYDGTTNQWTVIPRLMAKAAMQVSDIFRSVFGDAAMMTQVRPVLAAQIANSGTYSGLSYLDAPRHAGSSHYLYAIAGAPYIDVLNETLPLTVDQLFLEMTTYQSTYLAPWISTLASTARNYGVKMLAYEGGQTLYPSMANYTNKLAAQTDQRMKMQTVNLLNTWKAAGGDPFFYYELSSAWDNSGCWGLSPDITYDIDADPGYPTSEAMPKWGAIRQIATGR